MRRAPCPVVVIFAPTACGKTALARTLFGKSSLSPFKGCAEVVSADSQAVYRGLSIGTAKPDFADLQDIPHHVIDVVEPSVQFGVGEFVEAADRACEEIWSRGKLPLVIGGSGFYVRSFLLGLPATPQGDPSVHERLCVRLKNEGLPLLYEELRRVDAASARAINCHDSYRVLRALEVYECSGKPLSSFEMPSAVRSRYDCCTLVLTRDRMELYGRIDARVDVMFENGLADEVRALKAAGYTAHSPGMKAIGYREFFLGLSDEQILRQRIKKNSRRYAKKQYTFMRDIPGATTLPACDLKKISEIVFSFCRNHHVGEV